MMDSMTEHLCDGEWTNGTVASCGSHTTQTTAADTSPFDDRRTRLRVDGIAKSGEVSPKGTVEHLDYYSGRVAATAKPTPVNVVLKDLPWFRDRFVYRDGQWTERATGKVIEWNKKMKPNSLPEGSPPSKQNGAKPNSTAPSPPSSAPNFQTHGVGIGRGGAPLTPTVSNPKQRK